MNPENVSYLVNLFAKLAANPWFKVFAAIVLFFFDEANFTATAAVFVLILMDTVTGVIAAYKTGTLIESHKLLRTAIKVAVYFLLISAGRVSEHAVRIPFIDETVIAALAITELFSILENAAKAGYTVAARLLTKFTKQLDA
jgi:phage-related holin